MVAQCLVDNRFSNKPTLLFDSVQESIGSALGYQYVELPCAELGLGQRLSLLLIKSNQFVVSLNEKPLQSVFKLLY